jgi:hypothetical protein
MKDGRGGRPVRSRPPAPCGFRACSTSVEAAHLPGAARASCTVSCWSFRSKSCSCRYPVTDRGLRHAGDPRHPIPACAMRPACLQILVGTSCVSLETTARCRHARSGPQGHLRDPACRWHRLSRSASGQSSRPPGGGWRVPRHRIRASCGNGPVSAKPPSTQGICYASFQSVLIDPRSVQMQRAARPHCQWQSLPLRSDASARPPLMCNRIFPAVSSALNY